MRKNNFIPLILHLAFVLSLFAGCRKATTPRPYAYFRIDLPEPAYQPVETDTILPVSFEMSKYAEISTYRKHEDWINVDYPQWNARIHCSYMHINRDTFAIVTEESRDLAYKHTMKANAIMETRYENDTNHVYGILYEITGNAASPAQFYMTDSCHHFLRGSLYFNNLPNADSIAPVSEFILNDMMHLIETLRWK